MYHLYGIHVAFYLETPIHCQYLLSIPYILSCLICQILWRQIPIIIPLSSQQYAELNTLLGGHLIDSPDATGDYGIDAVNSHCNQ